MISDQSSVFLAVGLLAGCAAAGPVKDVMVFEDFAEIVVDGALSGVALETSTNLLSWESVPLVAASGYCCREDWCALDVAAIQRMADNDWLIWAPVAEGWPRQFWRVKGTQ